MKIGELVKGNVVKILQHCESDPDELARLMSADYSRRTFGLAWPFCADVAEITVKDHCRYWSDRHSVQYRQLRVCSQWFDKQRDAFCNYLSTKQITVTLQAPDKEHPALPPPRRGNGRYGSIQIGDAQNAFIRVILSRLGEETFDDRHWQEAKAYFDNACAYCDGTADEMDHGVPINRGKLGEHRLGNLIPACKTCNRDKRNQDYREYLRNDPERAQRIERYMVSKGYRPLSETDLIKGILEHAHKEIATLAERYIALLNITLKSPEDPAVVAL